MPFVMSVLFVYSADRQMMRRLYSFPEKVYFIKNVIPFLSMPVIEFYRLYFTDSLLAIIGSLSEIPCLFTME